ncbi:DnaJ subfamily A member 2 [Tritrichomonas foetus]|uniref:DnaJ subfamily A member 2 n=1 Tax=Tritrichomonas foetus TaxID=1144522 RepID=A0A1J4JXJ7_9EUKA|nr:DnaJ subfamily A member 2 [Tritrichomonas foetus]|eukprot:OHT03394.1 DnaJ subfamily A member 2 [Tritrichomonas foetus]
MVVDTKLYDVLGVPTNASDREIKRAFQQKAREFHPDKNPDPNATEKFQEISAAYDILKDPNKRREYDQIGLKGMNSGASGSAEDILHSFMSGFPFGSFGGFGSFDDFGDFHNSQQRRQRTEDIQYKMKVTLEDLYNGATKKIQINRTRICQQCKGKGVKNGCHIGKCNQCNGTGRVKNVTHRGSMIIQQITECSKCQSTGEFIKPSDKCEKCKGNKIINESKILEVHILPGMKNGDEQIFKGESDEVPGADTGDVIVLLCEKEHELFHRKKNDLYIKKEITLSQALLGEIAFPIIHLDGRTLILKGPENFVINDHTVLTIENEGMPSKENISRRGNLFVQFSVIFPQSDAITPDFADALNKTFPPKELNVDLESENVFEVTTEEADISEFLNSKKTYQETRNEAYDEDSDDESYHYQTSDGCTIM